MDIDAKVAFLRRPGAYPDQPGRVSVVETHMSWVFLTDWYVYKLKKPVRYPYLDFRTLDARHRDCLNEVALNRRLAPDVYLGVMPLTVSRDGDPALGADGDVADWLVHMRRLPAHRMLDRLIAEGRLSRRDTRAVGEVLAAFYRRLDPVEMTAAEYRRRIADDIAEYGRELADPAFDLDIAAVERLCALQREFLERRGSLLNERIDARRVAEGHGDLRPQHVCLVRPPVVIDCLEFNRGLRLLDAVDELSYLALECERLGNGPAGSDILSAYSSANGDVPPAALVAFYKGYRAMLRAKIAVWHNRDRGVREPDQWVERARRYIALAERHAGHLFG